MSNLLANSNARPSDQRWDAFVASLHLVWQYAPDISFEGQMNLAGRVVLVVHSDLHENARLAMQLSKVGLRVFSALDLPQAYDRLVDEEIDIVLLFFQGDDENAKNFCAAIQDEVHLQHVKLIALGDLVSSEAIWEWRRAGARYFVRVPVDPYVLFALMAASLDRD
jgi:DNA-binding response OmpR family regulator